MVLWNVKLFDKVLVTVTDEDVAKGITSLLNGGSLYGVPGDPAAYEDARGSRDFAGSVEKASAERVREKRPTRKQSDDDEVEATER